jgi:hypothetical protein
VNTCTVSDVGVTLLCCWLTRFSFFLSLTARDAAPELKRAWTKLAPGGQGMQLVKLSE